MFSNRDRMQALLQRFRASRRTMLTAAIAGLGSVLLPRAAPAQEQERSTTDAASLRVPPWDAVPSCNVSATDRAGQGPFFVHDGERDDDVSLYRQDLRGHHDPAAEPGIEMQLHVRLLDASDQRCGRAPLQDVEVHVWHCDAQGYYSGFGEPGEQTPDQPYRFRPNHNDLDNARRFCRGAAISDANGVVSFRSIFPGWYNGRDIHVHLMVLQRGSQPRGRTRYRDGDHLYTTQLYFEPALIDRVHRSSEPYLRRTALPAYAGAILGDERGNSGLRFKATFEDDIVIAQIQLILDSSDSRA